MKQFVGIIFICGIIQRSISENLFSSVLELSAVPVDEKNINDEINGSGLCSMVAGCKVLGGRKACIGPSGTNICSKCGYSGEVSKRNLMRADFYKFDREGLDICLGTIFDFDDLPGNCPHMPFTNDMVDHMLLKGTGIARMPQGALFQSYEFDVPKLKLNNIYNAQFCGKKDCYPLLRNSCLKGSLLPHIRYWCLTALGWLKNNIDELKGPSSYVLFLAAKISDVSNQLSPATKVECVDPEKTEEIKIECVWPSYNPHLGFEEKAVLTAAAASSVFLLGKWFSSNIEPRGPVKEFGLAVHHSIWIAIYAGRLRLTLQKLDSMKYQRFNHVPGTETMCDVEDAKIAENYEGRTGTAYATLCTLFKTKGPSEGPTFTHPNLRYRPEIHTRHSLGCVERTNGMIFLKPGDWITPNAQMSIIGSAVASLGLLFHDNNNLTTLELTKTVTTLYPPSIAEAMKDQENTICTKAKGNGPNYSEKFGKAGLAGIGGMCNWVPVW